MVTCKNLFSPGHIRHMAIPNRIVMSPMQTFSYETDGLPNKKTIEYFAARARGGVGLIICPGAKPSPESHAPKTPALYDDKVIPYFLTLTETIHREGAKVAQQINHTGKALTYNQALKRTSGLPESIGPSPLKYVKTGVLLREATHEDIHRICEQISEAARRARDAGFDMVELHAAHGYLLGSFLSSFSNRRNDEYGGSPENRARFLCEIVKRIKEKTEPDFPVGVRISGSEFLVGGTTIEDTRIQAPLLVKAGADVLHISAGAHENTEVQFLSYLWPDAYLTNLARAVKKVVDIPVITVGKLGNSEVAEQVLEQGSADFVALGRQLLADPEWANKVREGRQDQINYCICCNNCWKRVFSKSRGSGRLYCTVNPAVLREQEFELRPAPSAKNVSVVGGGLAGMEVARVAALRGHKVTLYEKNNQLGGQFLIACQQPDKGNYLSLLKRQIQGVREAGVTIITNTIASVSILKESAPEVVVLATGAVPRKIPVPGIDRPNVVQGIDVIQGKATIGDKIAVIGGRLIGMEVALDLSKQGKKVFLITDKRLGENGEPLEENIYRTLRNRLIDQGVQFFTGCPLLEINAGGVFIDDNGNLLFLSVDTVVLAVGSAPVTDLFDELKSSGLEVYAIGDCKEPRDALEAMHEGTELGRKI